MTGFCKKIATLLSLVALACAVPADCRGFDQPTVAGTQAIPTPAETPAKVIVNGRSSTAQSILIRDLGERIPPTFSADRLKNTEGSLGTSANITLSKPTSPRKEPNIT